MRYGARHCKVCRYGTSAILYFRLLSVSSVPLWLNQISYAVAAATVSAGGSMVAIAPAVSGASESESPESPGPAAN